LTQDHLAVARRNTLAFGTDKTIEARLISGVDAAAGFTASPFTNGHHPTGKEPRT
jgi:hypothetical protein